MSTDSVSLLQSREKFSQWGYWPQQPVDVNPEGWLANFSSADERLALALLDSFVYVNGALFLAMLRSSIHMLGRSPHLSGPSATSTGGEWEHLLSTALFTFPTGEVPNATDSGHLIVRHLRNEFRLDEDLQIFDPAALVRHLDGERPGRHIVMMDDFSGSGQQIIKTLERPVQLPGGRVTTLFEVAASHRLIVVPVVATRFAVRTLKVRFPTLSIQPGHLLPSDASLLNSVDGTVFAQFGQVGVNRVKTIHRTARLKVPHYVGPTGFAGLSLALGFEHSVPDATIPLFWAEGHNWQPLFPRR